MTTTTQESDHNRVVTGILLISSLLVGFCAAYIIFVLFLQTPAVSGSRLAMAGILMVFISSIDFISSRKWMSERILEIYSRTPKLISVCLILPAVFLPLYYTPPAYPQSPLLRPWTDLAVQFGLTSGSGPVTISEDNVKLVADQDAVGLDAFLKTGDWQTGPKGLTLSPGSTGALQWTSPAAQTVSLTVIPPSADGTLVIYWDGTRTTVQLNPASQEPVVLVKKYPLPWGFNLLFFLSVYILISWFFLLVLVFLGLGFRYLDRFERWKYLYWFVLVLMVPLTILTVKLQLDSLAGGLNYLSSVQLARHTAVLTGQAPNPWQYRVFSEVLVEFIIRAYQFISIKTAFVPAFISLRLIQNSVIFLLAFALYKKISNSSLLALLGILILASSMKNAFYDNDLSFNTYFDIVFYLLAVWLLLARNYYAVVIVMIFAALNRETSGLIPFLMAAAILDEHQPLVRKSIPVLLSVGIFVISFIGLRILFPERPLYIPFKHPPGFPLLLYNLTRQFSWNQLFGTLGLIPFLGLFFFFAWPRLWQRYLLIVCPIWFGIHFFASVIDETRLFLVPQALIFIPGILFALNYLLATKSHIPQDNLTFYESR